MNSTTVSVADSVNMRSFIRSDARITMGNDEKVELLLCGQKRGEAEPEGPVWQSHRSFVSLPCQTV
jgi:hypothetical protein